MEREQRTAGQSTHIKYTCATGENGKKFVGIRVSGNSVTVHYPESYTTAENGIEKADIIELLKSISLAKTKAEDSSEPPFDSHAIDTDFAILSYVRLIEDYMQNGIYSDTEKHYRTNVNGRVSWKRTLDGQPLVSSGNIVYKDLVVQVKSPVQNMLVECYVYCLRKSLDLMGWLFDLTANALGLPCYPSSSEKFYLRAVLSELDRTFDDRKRTRLIHMRNVLTGLDEVRNADGLVYGVDSYHYVFERMIDGMFGNVSRNEIQEYYPHVKWRSVLSESDFGEEYSTLRPDTILKRDDNIFIIDSKYYRYGSLNLFKKDGLPESASIQKQILYGSYVHSKYGAPVYNAFILPYNKIGINSSVTYNKTLWYAGCFIPEKENEDYNKVHVFLIDLYFLVHNWYKVTGAEMQSELVNGIRLHTG